MEDIVEIEINIFIYWEPQKRWKYIYRRTASNCNITWNMFRKYQLPTIYAFNPALKIYRIFEPGIYMFEKF